jgi:cytochrome c oxidase subunit 2
LLHIHRYERTWLTFGMGILVVLLATITTAALVEGFVPPSRVQTIDPTKVSQTPPFDHPGLHRISNGVYEAYYVGHIFAFDPQKIEVPVGSRVTFYVTSTDVEHGFAVPETGINVMVTPGWVSSVSYTFKKAGSFLLLCHEYCGTGHQYMFGTIVVK